MVSGLVLAAGSSRRFGSNKLLESIAGQPIISYVVNAAASAALDEIIVVLGHDRARVDDVLPDSVRTVFNPRHGLGMSTSLISGIDVLDDDCEAVVVLLGDVPGVLPEHIEEVVSTYLSERPAAVRPIYEGEPGHPVLLSRELFPEVAKLRGDQGARSLLQEVGSVIELDMLLPAPLDVDTPQDVELVRASLDW